MATRRHCLPVWPVARNTCTSHCSCLMSDLLLVSLSESPLVLSLFFAMNSLGILSFSLNTHLQNGNLGTEYILWSPGRRDRTSAPRGYVSDYHWLGDICLGTITWFRSCLGPREHVVGHCDRGCCIRRDLLCSCPAGLFWCLQLQSTVFQWWLDAVLFSNFSGMSWFNSLLWS